MSDHPSGMTYEEACGLTVDGAEVQAKMAGAKAHAATVFDRERWFAEVVEVDRIAGDLFETVEDVNFLDRGPDDGEDIVEVARCLLKLTRALNRARIVPLTFGEEPAARPALEIVR